MTADHLSLLELLSFSSNQGDVSGWGGLFTTTHHVYQLSVIPPSQNLRSGWLLLHNTSLCVSCDTWDLLAVYTMTQMDYKYSLLGSSVDDYRKRPLLLQVDDTPMNLFAVLEVKRELPRRWSTLGCFRKIRLYSFLFALAVMFLIMASYILTGDKKGLLLTPSPYHFSSLVSPGPFAFNLSSVKDYAHIKLVVKSITSKVEFRNSRQLPELKALVNSEPHVSTQNINLSYLLFNVFKGMQIISKSRFFNQTDCHNEYLFYSVNVISLF